MKRTMKRILAWIGIIIMVLFILTLFQGCSQPNTVSEKVEVTNAQPTPTPNKVFTGEPVYMFTLELRQTHFTIDISQHIKDAMNKTQFDIAVDKRLYDMQNVGDELLSEFRSGSFFIKGSMGDWKVTIANKYVIKE